MIITIFLLLRKAKWNPDVLLTAHQAFFTKEALHQIGETTINNINYFIYKRDNKNTLKPESHIAAI
jgi:lactate dehydrogenase-like 2-hydroxyacid dehydrogenase